MDTELEKEEVVEETPEAYEEEFAIDEEAELIYEASKKIKDLFYDFYMEIENYKNGESDVRKIEDYISVIKEQITVCSKYPELEEDVFDYKSRINGLIRECMELPELSKDKSSLRRLLFDCTTSGNSLNINLENIDVTKISELYDKLYESIESKDLKEITACRGRLIRFLKSEKEKIDSEYNKALPVIKIRDLLKKSDVSLEEVNQELDKDEYEDLIIYLEGSLGELEALRNKIDELMQSEEVQKIIFLEGALGKELKKHGCVLDERFSKEFLDKKGTLTSVITVLPNAISLSIKKLANTINELKEAKTNRKKINLIGETVKDSLGVVATPILYTGKFIASNWYTMYLAYKGITQAKAQKEEEERRKQEEERRRQEEEARKQEEERRRQEEEARKQEEERRRQEEERRRQEEEQRQREEEERRQREEEARRREEEIRRQQEEERQRQEEAERQRQAELERQRQEEAERQRQEELERQRQEEQNNQNNSHVPTPEDLEDRYPGVIGSELVGLIASIAFDGNIYEQLVTGVVTPDTTARVTYIPVGVPWWQFWNFKTESFTLREIQQIWNWWPDVDLDVFYDTHGKNKN